MHAQIKCKLLHQIPQFLPICICTVETRCCLQFKRQKDLVIALHKHIHIYYMPYQLPAYCQYSHILQKNTLLVFPMATTLGEPVAHWILCFFFLPSFHFFSPTVSDPTIKCRLNQWVPSNGSTSFCNQQVNIMIN